MCTHAHTYRGTKYSGQTHVQKNKAEDNYRFAVINNANQNTVEHQFKKWKKVNLEFYNQQKISFKNKGEIKMFLDIENLKKFTIFNTVNIKENPFTEGKS